MLRPEFVERKLQLIAEELGRLSDFRDITYDQLVSDAVRLAAVERMLERIVIRAIDVNEHLIAALATGEEARSTRLTYRHTFLALADLGVYSHEFAQRIATSAALRNIMVHEYNDLDHRIVHGSIRTALRDYTVYVDAAHRFLKERR